MIGRSQTSWLLACSAWLLSGPMPAGAEGQAPDRRWTAPPRIAVVAWPDGGEPLSLRRTVGASEPLSLRGREVALVPVRPGDWLNVTVQGAAPAARGAGVAVGLASGRGAWPDAITWWDRVRMPWRVPSWSDARYCALRSRDGGPVQVSVNVASTPRDAFAWYRYDARVARWARRGASAPLPAPMPDPDVAAPLRLLRLYKQALAEAGVAPGASAPWIIARWLERSRRTRPLLRPFFVRAPLELASDRGSASGAGAAVPASDAWRVLDAGDTLSLRGAAGQVAVLRVQAARPGTTTVVVSENDRVARRVVVRASARAAGVAPWTRARVLRFELPRAAPQLRVRVIEGKARFGYSGYRQRSDLFDASALRQVDGALPELARGRSGGHAGRAVAAALAALTLRGDRASWHRVGRVLRARGVPDALRAVALTELVRHAGPVWPRFAEDVARAFDAAAALPPPRRHVLQRALLERLASLSVDARAFERHRPRVAPPAAGASEDVHAVFALSRRLARKPSDVRPLAASLAERYAAQAGSAAATRRARALWRREAPMRSLPAEPGVASSLDWRVPSHPSGRCATHGGGGAPAWSVLRGRVTVEVAATGGTHELASFRALQPSQRDAWVHVDGVPIAVHGSIGVSGRAAVRPGLRTIDTGGHTVLARIPRQGRVPCGELREPRRFYAITGGTYFQVPLGRGETVARIAPRQPPDADRPARMRVQVGERRFGAWVLPRATGTISLPVAAGAGSVWVQSDDALAVRVSARLAPAPARDPRQLTRKAEGQGRDEAASSLLAALRRQTSRVRRADAARLPEAWLRRADALWRLGYRTLARLDAGRAGERDWRRPRARDAWTAIQTHAVLPEHTADVVAVGELSRIAPLAHGAPSAGLQRPLALLRDDASSVQVASYFERAPAFEQTGASTNPSSDLLHAVLAERAGLDRQAARHFERFGRATGSAVALGRAATLWTDVAAVRRDRELATRALRLAALAERWASRESGPGSSPAEGALFRLHDVLRWLRPLAAQRAAGTALLEHVHGEDEERTLGRRVRRALTGAPEQATLIDEERELYARLPSGRSLLVHGLCHSLEGPDERCRVQLSVDGRARACEPSAPRGGEPSPQTARVVHCKVAVQPREQRVQVRLVAPGRALGWVLLRDEGGAALTKHVVSRWHEIEPGRPLELPVAAGSVVRLRARGTGAAAELEATVVTGGEPQTERLALPAERDETSARFFGADAGRHEAPVGTELRRWLVVPPGEEPGLVRVRVDRGRALVIAEVGLLDGLPEPRARADLAAPPPVPPLPRELATPRLDGELGSVPRAAFPLTLGAQGGWALRELGEADDEPTLSYGELTTYALSMLAEERLWLEAQLTGRARAGPESSGASAALWFAPPGRFVPGVYASGRAFVQRLDGATALGARGVLGLRWLVPLSHELTLSPRVTSTFRRADPRVARTPALATRADVDHDVYTDWTDDNPRTLSLGVRALHRPLVDARLRYEIEARSVPDVDQLDRLDVAVDADALPGSGYVPWLRALAELSYRPAHAGRSAAFTRTSLGVRAMVWQWLGRSIRLSLTGELRYRFDLPAVTNNDRAWSGALVLGVEHSFGRGLADHTPRQRVFRARQQEGAGLTRWRRRPDHLPQEAPDG